MASMHRLCRIDRQFRKTDLPATSSARRRTRAERRSPLKPALMIAGALACFGAGTAVPQLQALMSSGTSYWGILDTASGPSASVDQLAKLDALKSAKPQAAVPISGPANSGVAQPAQRTQRRERPAAKRSNLLAATNARRSARRQIGPLPPDALPGTPVNRVATKT
jgi:hypothetical protein